MTSPHSLLPLLAHLALEPTFTRPYGKPTSTPKPKRARKLRNKRKHQAHQRRRNRRP